VSAGNRNSGLRMALNVRNDIAPRKLPLEVASEEKSRRRQSSLRSSGYRTPPLGSRMWSGLSMLEFRGIRNRK